MSARIDIDGQPKRLESFAVPDMSLSSARASMVRHHFAFTMDVGSFLELMTPVYEAWVRESTKDDELCGAPQDALAEAGYPCVRELLDKPRLLELVFGHYLLHEFLGRSTWDGRSEIEYWHDEVEGCQRKGQFVELTGICYSRPAGPNHALRPTGPASSGSGG